MNAEQNDRNGSERSEDWAWFGAHPERSHHCRLATTEEIARLQQEQGLDIATLPRGCFVYAISRLIRRRAMRGLRSCATAKGSECCGHDSATTVRCPRGRVAFPWAKVLRRPDVRGDAAPEISL